MAQAYYELSFDPPRAEHPDEYHHIEVQVAKPGLTARTREGYYSATLGTAWMEEIYPCSSSAYRSRSCCPEGR